MAGNELIGLRFLVIDDTEGPGTAYQIGMLLRSWGANRIYQAKDATVALATLAKFPVEAVICPSTMAPVDGLSFIRYFRGSDEPKDSNTPVILLAKGGNPSCMENAGEAGIDGIVKMPVHGEELLACLLDVFAGRRKRNSPLEHLIVHYFHHGQARRIAAATFAQAVRCSMDAMAGISQQWNPEAFDEGEGACAEETDAAPPRALNGARRPATRQFTTSPTAEPSPDETPETEIGPDGNALPPADDAPEAEPPAPNPRFAAKERSFSQKRLLSELAKGAPRQ